MVQNERDFRTVPLILGLQASIYWDMLHSIGHHSIFSRT